MYIDPDDKIEPDPWNLIEPFISYGGEFLFSVRESLEC